MFGNRFIDSVTRSALTVAGAASVLLCSSAVHAQGYHHTPSPRYARTQLPELSAKATQPPAFSDSAIESVAMSPNGWGESAITNPYAGYDRGETHHRTAATPGRNPAGGRSVTPTRSGRGVIIVNDFFSPSSLKLEQLPAPAKPVGKTTATPSALAPPSDQSSSTITPLTNTDYPKFQPQRHRDAQSAAAAHSADRYASRSFSIYQAPELSPPPQLPAVTFPLDRQIDANSDNDADTFDQIPEDAQAPDLQDVIAEIEPSPEIEPSVEIDTPDTRLELEAPGDFNAMRDFDTADDSDVTADQDAAGERESLPLTAPNLNSPRIDSLPKPSVPATAATPAIPATPTIPAATPSAATPDNSVNSFLPSIGGVTGGTLGRADIPTIPRQPAPPAFTQPRPQTTAPRQQFTPAAPTFQQSPHYAQQSSGPVSNQWGYGYPESGQWQTQPHVETPYSIFDHGDNTAVRPTNVGQRSVYPTTRNHTIFDRGESFDHEVKKKEFPPFGEIIATGRFFGSLDLAYLRPHFLGNTGISIDGPAFSESIPFEFDNETAPHVRFGFESKYGPGFELNYFTLNANSNPISETFNGVAPITTIASISGPNRFTQLSADQIGETLNANHSFELETISFNVFKEIQFKVSRLNGQFGFTYANIAQSLQASVTDDGGNILDTLDSTSDFRGFGPKFGIEYYRPLGHTPLEFITSFNGTGLFGRRDQFVNNTTDLVQRRFGADEFVTVLDFTSGLQYKKTIAENRSWFARVAFVHQSWLGGGTAVDPQGDFGLKGFTFGVGLNR